MDYSPVDQNLIYRPKIPDITMTLNITINDDSDAEDDEDFEITVTPVRNIVILTPVIRVTILCDENDGGIFHLLYDKYFFWRPIMYLHPVFSAAVSDDPNVVLCMVLCCMF